MATGHSRHPLEGTTERLNDITQEHSQEAGVDPT